MKILFLLTQDLESPSGLGRYYPLARELSRQGHQVRVAALHSDFESIQARRQEINGVKVHYVSPMHVMKSGNQKSYYHSIKLIVVAFRAVLALSWAALKYPADIIYVGKPHPMNSIAGLLAKILYRVPLVVDCDDYEAGLGRFSGQWQKKIIEFFEKHVPPKANAVTTHTHFMRDSLISWGVPLEKIIYLPNGVDPERFVPPDSARVEAKKKKLNLIGKKVIAYIGSLSMPSHPVSLLIDAFAEVQRRFPESILMIVGGGEELVNLQKQVIKLGLENTTRFVGRVSPDDVSLYYSLANISIDPIQDNPAARGRSPLKLFESWICGVPFVSVNVGERAYLMGEPPAGLLVSSEQIVALAEGITAILSSDDLARTFISRGKERVKNYYWESLSQSLDNLFTSFYKESQ